MDSEAWSAAVHGFAKNQTRLSDRTELRLLESFPGVSAAKESACNAEGMCSIPGSGRSPREGNGNPPQYSCLEKSMDKGAWWATVHGVKRDRDSSGSKLAATTRLSGKEAMHVKRWFTGENADRWKTEDKCLILTQDKIAKI